MILSLEIVHHPFSTTLGKCGENCCVSKKCCKSYKDGKRCKKCPDR